MKISAILVRRSTTGHHGPRMSLHQPQETVARWRDVPVNQVFFYFLFWALLDPLCLALHYYLTPGQTPRYP